MKHQNIKRLLPEVFQRTDQPGSALYAILETMEALTEPAEDILQQVPDYFNPYLSPEKFLPFLASWVDLDRFFPSLQQPTIEQCSVPKQNYGNLRELILAAPKLSKLRGTSAGLKLFLETATGQTGFEIKENSEINGEKQAFHIEIIAQKKAKKHSSLIKRIIEQEKPAYVTYQLEFKDQ